MENFTNERNTKQVTCQDLSLIRCIKNILKRFAEFLDEKSSTVLNVKINDYC